MKQCSLPLVFFICPDPQPFIPPPICPLPLSSHLSFLGLSDCSCYRWGEHGGFVSVRMCFMTRRRSWKMRQMVAIYQHLSGAWRRSGRGSWGGAESDTEGFSLWGWPWWNGCGFSSAASNRQGGGGWIKREKEREKGRGKGLSSVCRLPLPHQAAAFLPQQFPLHHLHHPPPPPLIPGSKPLKVCSATVQCALFPLAPFFSLLPLQFVSLLAWKQMTGRRWKWGMNRGRNFFTVQWCHVNSRSHPAPYSNFQIISWLIFLPPSVLSSP